MAPYSRSYGRTMVKAVLESESEGLTLVGARPGRVSDDSGACLSVLPMHGAVRRPS